MLEKTFDSTLAIPIPDENITQHCVDKCDFLKKEASADSVSYFNDLKPKKNHLYFLVVAMSDGAYFGSNKNGDFFKEDTLQRCHQDFKKAGVFWNHDNKDASKSSGSVLATFYNTKMHRVELVVEVPKKNAKYLESYIKAGTPIAVSMGLKVSMEYCSICGHVTRKSYANRCEHLKYSMNKVLHDGKKVFAICGDNVSVFDISFVFRPADRIGYTLLTKQASASSGGLSNYGR